MAIGAGTAASTQSWIGGPIRFQSAKLGKIAPILALVRLLSSREEPPVRLKHLPAPGAMVTVPPLLSPLAGLVVGLILAFDAPVELRAEYQRNRLLVFLDRASNAGERAFTRSSPWWRSGAAGPR